MKLQRSAQFFIFFFLSAIATFVPRFSFALSVVQVSLPQHGVYLNKQFTLPLTITASEQINAISFDIVVPHSMTIVGINDGGSIISFWLEKPTFNSDTQHVYFSGIVPGGFVGQGTLLNLVLIPKEVGTSALAIQKAEVHHNNSGATADSFGTGPLEISVLPEGANGAAVIEDSDDTQKPEPFEITVTQDASLFDNDWIAVFNTQDKKSGIAHYEVAETKHKVTDGDYSKLSWNESESPYVLSDQRLASYIYVKAVDNNNNEQIEEHPPQYPVTWYDALVFKFGTGFVLFILACYVLWYLHRQKHIIKRRRAHRHQHSHSEHHPHHHK